MRSSRVARVSMVSLMAVAVHAGSLMAQRPEGPWRALPVRAQLSAVAGTAHGLLPLSYQPDSVVIPPTHWKEGGLIVGTAFGLLGAIGAVQLCGYDSVCHSPAVKAVAGFAFGALVGFGLGALIGGQFPKHASHFRWAAT